MTSAATASSAPALVAPSDAERIDPARLLAFLAMCFGMFMAFLDIQIVSASLAEIQAGLAASSDEISWVQTSYLIAEVVAIPLSGFLWRAIQGFIGGGMVPTVFASIYTVFPRSRQPMIVPLVGLVATLAPTIGP